MAEDSKTQKRELRRRVLACRGGLRPKERERGAVLLAERILGHQWYYTSKKLLAFVGYGSEIDTCEILREALRQGKQVYLPRVLEPAGDSGSLLPEMAFFRISSLQELIPGYRGIPEPPDTGELYVYLEEEAAETLMLMPGVAFDVLRNRLGYGKGFYDRYLQDKPKLCLRTIGAGFLCQLVEQVPQEEGDIRPYQVICV